VNGTGLNRTEQLDFGRDRTFWRGGVGLIRHGTCLNIPYISLWSLSRQGVIVGAMNYPEARLFGARKPRNSFPQR
jgi:hypothetical protein